MNIYLKAAFAIALLIAGFVGGCSYKQRELDSLKADYAEQVQAGLQANRELEQRIQVETNAIAAQYQQEKAETEKTIEQLRKELKDAQKKNPLPDNCRPDAERLRIVQQAVNAANQHSASR